MRVISNKELPQVSGAATNTCTYADQSYSLNAVVSIGGGYFQQCQYGGSWSAPYKLQ